MAWLARSIANSLNLDDEEEEVPAPTDKQSNPQNDDVSSPTRGVKEDLSELTKTLTTQFWGVASFLAPPPPQSEPKSDSEPKPDPKQSDVEDDSLLGIRGDFAEIGGKFRIGISRLSNNIKNVSEMTKMVLQLNDDDEEDDDIENEGMRGGIGGGDVAVGVNEEVVAFVRDIAMHPETWINFPLPRADDDVDEDFVDFDMSDAQQEHALAVERLVPRLAALRIELCPVYMSESYFWKIYFVLVHPRLDKQDALLLSTPQIVEARALLAHGLKSRITTKPEGLSEEKSFDSEETPAAVSHHEESLSVPSPIVSENKQKEISDLKISNSTSEGTSDIMSHIVESDKSQVVDKPVIEEKDGGKVKTQYPQSDVEKDEDDADDWLKEETSEIGGAVGKSIPIENEDDVSFSDLEEDDDADVPTSYRKSNYSSSDKESRDWVQLGKSSADGKHSSDSENTNKESSDWLDVDDIVVA